MTNILRRMFTGQELYDWFHNEFPDSFSIEIYKDKPNQRGILYTEWDDRVWSFFSQHELAPSKRNHTKFALYDRAIFEVGSGDENSYIRFVVEDENANYFIVSWGYKRGDVEEDYILKLITLLLNTIRNREICADHKFETA